MAKHSVVCGLDVGTTKVTVCIGEVQEGLINVVGTASAPNSGLRKGMVVDVEETVSAISAAIEEAERASGMPLTSAVVGISGSHITSIESKGVIAVSRADGEITQTDVERVIEAARAVALPPNQDIIHVIPRVFIVDGQDGIKDPVGMTGIRLEAETHIIGGSANAIKNLTKCVYQAGLEVNDLVFSPLATAKALLSKRQKELGVMLVDFGAGTCGVVVFEEGDVLACSVVPIGSLHITNDIAIGLRTSIDTADKIKLHFAQAQTEGLRESETVDLRKIDPDEDQKPQKRYIAEIVEARLNEIFSMVKEDLRSIGKDGMLPAGIVFTGGGAKLDCLIDYAKKTLGLPAQIGHPSLEISGLVDKLDDPLYAESVGLMLWGLEKGISPGKFSIDFNKMGGVVEKVKSILKHLAP